MTEKGIFFSLFISILILFGVIGVIIFTNEPEKNMDKLAYEWFGNYESFIVQWNIHNNLF